VVEAAVSSPRAAQAAEAGSIAPDLPAQIPSLDGLRAVSVLAVIVGHAVDTYGGPIFLGPARHLGNLGVRVFFLISGFLITTLLLREYAARGRISLRNFYIRRTIRIWPAAYAFLAVVAVLYALDLVVATPRDFAHAATFTMNYYDAHTWVLNHLWSLAVEEQFYLVWPLLILLAGVRRLRAAALVLVSGALVVRWLLWHADGGATGEQMTRRFEAVADALAAGALLACCYNAWMANGAYRAFVLSLFAPLTGLALLGGSFLGYFVAPELFYVYGQTLANAGILLLINHSVASPGGLAGTLLNWRPLAFVGVISYSLYLWQNLFLNPDRPYWWATFPTNVGLTFAAGVLSYYLVEKPFGRLRARFSA
jgi:peptidoglycan/LPS O-acetylase OafA/YrhL